MNITIKLKNLILVVFLLGVFFIPFNSFEGFAIFGILGEYNRDSCVLFFLLCSVIIFFTGKIKIPYNNIIFQLLILFIVWVILSIVFNSYDMSNYYYKHRTGFERFIRQFISLLISSIILFITFYNILEKFDLKTIVFKIRKVFLYSLVIVVIYGSIEFLIIKFYMDGLRSTLHLFDYFPFTSVNIDRWTRRISSVTFEPPALATYLLTIAGWMFSYIITEKGFKRFLPGIFVVLFSLLSESRAVFFIMIIQVFVFILYLMRKKKFNSLFVKIFLVSVFTSAAVFTFFLKLQ